MPPQWKYFAPEEVTNLDPEFVSKLDLATAHTADIDPEGRRFPFTITSGFRTPTENEQAHGACHSAHCLVPGMAVDLRVSNPHEVFLVVAGCITVGLHRFGFYVDENFQPTHVHVDAATDDLHVPQVMWIKKEGATSAPASA